MSTARFDHGRHENNALSVVNDNPEMAKVFAISRSPQRLTGWPKRRRAPTPESLWGCEE